MPHTESETLKQPHQIHYGKETAFEVSTECNDADFMLPKKMTKTSRRQGSLLKRLLGGCGRKKQKGGLVYWLVGWW